VGLSMNQVMKIDKPVTMSSREIAELTGKEHRNVKRDVQKMLLALKLDVLTFEHIYLDALSRRQAEYHLDRDLTETLITGYNVPLRFRVVTRLRELESVSHSTPAIPQSLPDALRLAADLAEQNSHLQLVVADQAPKVHALELLSAACGTMCLTDAAKHLYVQRKALLDYLKANRWIYRREGSARWVAYQPRIASGLLDHKVTVIGTDEQGDKRLASQVRVTPRGLALLAQKIAVGAV
jgi:phage antirepressor YoqD-like protein